MRRTRFPRWRLGRRGPWWVVGLLVLWLLFRIAQQWQPETAPPAVLAEGVYAVQRVVDGDTLLLANGARIRLIGADAPETVHPQRGTEPFGPEATALANQLIAEADGCVRLQFDRQRVDKYGRFLAYVWVGQRMLNEELIRAGLARAESEFAYAPAMKARFAAAQAEARAARRGMWSLGSPAAGL